MKKMNLTTEFTPNNQLINELSNDARIIKFLKQNNLGIEFLKNHSIKFKEWINELDTCKKCFEEKKCVHKVKGYMLDLRYDGILDTTLIPCEYEKSINKEREYLKNYIINDLSEDFKKVDFLNIDLLKEDGSYQKVLQEIFENIKNNQGVYIYGNVGSGKTYLAACACNKFAKEGKKVAFINLPAFIYRCKNMILNNEYEKEVNKAIRAEFLVIDDIGAENITQFTRDEILFNILNYRMENKKTTWFTSNESLESLETQYTYANKQMKELVKSQRLLSRVKSLSNLVKLTGKDRRNK